MPFGKSQSHAFGPFNGTLPWRNCSIHTSKIKDLCSSLNSEEKLQNFLYLYKKKTQVVFFGILTWAQNTYFGGVFQKVYDSGASDNA